MFSKYFLTISYDQMEVTGAGPTDTSVWTTGLSPQQTQRQLCRKSWWRGMSQLWSKRRSPQEGDKARMRVVQ